MNPFTTALCAASTFCLTGYFYFADRYLLCGVLFFALLALSDAIDDPREEE